MTAKLEVRGVSYSYHSLEDETLALSDISFSVESGQDCLNFFTYSV